MELERGLRVIAMAIALAQDLSIIHVVGAQRALVHYKLNQGYQNKQSIQQFLPS